MSSKTLSTQSLLDLIGLFERSNQSIADADGQRLRGMPGWDVLKRTSLSQSDLSAWTECVGYAGHFPAPCGDERVPVELQEDEDPGRYSYRCPETFRLKYVSVADVAIHSVKSARLLHVVADLLEIPQALRSGIEATPAVDGLWHLGKARIGAAHTDVWFARDLSTSIIEIFRHFSSPALPDQGLILSSGMALPDFVRPPGNYRFVSLRDAIIDYVPRPRMDMGFLQRTLASPADGTLRPVLPVHFDEYTHTLAIRTKDKPWVIKGDRQAAAVRYMYGQAQNDRWLLGAAEILGAAYPDKKTARSQRMQNLFSGNQDWQDYIHNPERGMYGFLC
jgi:hypothetical protein